MINSRILNVKYVDQDFKVLTPNTLIYGFWSDIFPRVVEFEPRNEKLFARVKVLEDQIKVFERIYLRTYANDLLKITKYRRRRQELEVNDIVLIANKMCKGTKSLALGQIVDKKSDRTFLVRYISRESRLDEKTFEIKRVAIKKIFERSAQSLIFVCKPHERDEIELLTHTSILMKILINRRLRI